MKKALVVFLALAMIAGVFADEPVAEASVATFSGNASVTWGVDLDVEKTGFKNDASADLKVTLVNGGEKATSGEGVWAELKIKTDGLQINNAGIEKGTASVEAAKIHFGPAYVGIKSGDTVLGEFKSPRINDSNDVKVPNVGTDRSQGIVIGYSAGDIFSIDADFRSVEKYDNDYAAALDITSKPISGLTLKAGANIGFETFWNAEEVIASQTEAENIEMLDERFAAGASAAYKMNIGDNGMYIEPGIGYVNKLRDVRTAEGMAMTKGQIAFGFVFGLNGDGAADSAHLMPKAKAGVSVATLLDFDEGRKYSDNTAAPGTIPLYVDFFTGTTLVDGLAASAFVYLDDLTGVYAEQAKTAKMSGLSMGIGAKYAAKVNELTITPNAGFTLDSDTAEIDASNKTSATVANLKIGVDLGGLINNTTFSVLYTGGPFSKNVTTAAGTTETVEANKKGTIDFTVKISF